MDVHVPVAPLTPLHVRHVGSDWHVRTVRYQRRGLRTWYFPFSLRRGSRVEGPLVLFLRLGEGCSVVHTVNMTPHYRFGTLSPYHHCLCPEGHGRLGGCHWEPVLFLYCTRTQRH